MPNSLTRRRLLQATLAGSLFLPHPYAWVWAQSDGAVRLLRLPKQALVIGNSAYAKVPALVNPGNDARGLAEALRASGFTVVLLLDASRQDMATAIDAHAKALAEKKCVGLFYFAGHGLQLDWHNYLAPVDAEIARVEDISARCVNVSALIGGIKRAANPMNVIILDACRENPFASQARIEQKGLSQMDAPSGTLLAYATAPGNLASDGGTAKNGLYTERLLREMRVPEAKIEDVFKRVRLGVRLASRGQQIPWESTSLEEDFYFNPPEQLKKVSREQEEAAFAEERDLFEKARAARQAPALQDYLIRYPRGRFAELAQLQLDGLLAAQGERPIEIASSKGNPLTTGSARADTRFKVGDWYGYYNRNRADVREWRGRRRVTAISDVQVEFNEGALVLDLLGNLIKNPNGQRFTARQDIPLEFVVGKRWTTRFEIVAGAGLGMMELDYRIVTREKVTVPAGTFDCFRLEGTGYNTAQAHEPVEVRLTFWYSPPIRQPIAWEEVKSSRRKGRFEDTRHELTGYFQQA